MQRFQEGDGYLHLEYRIEVKAGDSNLRDHLFRGKTVLFLFYEMGSCYVALARLELTIFLPQIPECWEHRYCYHI